MAEELSQINLADLSVEAVRSMKNQAVARLKKAGHLSLHDAMHQNGINHGNHVTSIADFDDNVEPPIGNLAN